MRGGNELTRARPRTKLTKIGASCKPGKGAVRVVRVDDEYAGVQSEVFATRITRLYSLGG